ncbi:MAG: protein kinase [candidate division Zixibacteria bacterium]|nr:protein kinase [candidate division Zixibacteria bacterium]
MSKKFTPIVFFLLITMLVITLKLNHFEVIEKLELKLQDALHNLQPEPSKSRNIYVVRIDSRAEREFGKWPWKRELIADLIAAVGATEPRTVLVDLDLRRVDSSASNGDEIIAEQLRWMQNVTLSYDIVRGDVPSDTLTNPKYLFRNAIETDDDLGILEIYEAIPASEVALPAAPIADAAKWLGFRYVTVDPDSILRWEPLVAHFEGYYYPNAVVAAASHYIGGKPSDLVVRGGVGIRTMDRVVPTNKEGAMLVNFSPPGTRFNTFSAVDVFRERVGASVFEDKLVIISLDLEGHDQNFKSAISENYPHWERTATAIDNIIERRYLNRMDTQVGLYVLLLTAVGLICAVGLPLIASLYRYVVIITALFVWASAYYFFFSSFNLVVSPLFVALELGLFLLVSPLLEMRLGGFRLLSKKDEEESTEMEIAKAIRSTQGLTSQAKIKAEAFDRFEAQDVESLNQTLILAEKSETKTEAVEFDKTMVATAEPNKTIALEPNSVNPDKPIRSDSEETPIEESASVDVSVPSDSLPVDEPVALADVMPNKGRFTPSEENIPEPAERIDVPEESPVSASADSDVPANETPTPQIADELALAGSESNVKLGRYEIQGILGKGAMGLVYKGVDPAINRPVALKTIRLDFINDPEEMEELRERLFLEARAAGKLSHPNIVTIYDVGSEGSTQYIAMEYLQGETLEDMIKRKVSFNFKIIAKMIVQICNALQYAHDRGIVHRDIKPANIMVLPDYTIKVMDFGIARVESSSMTKTGIAMGTPNYISPEQLQGMAIDGRSDLFSLGVVTYELLLGRRPFKGQNLTNLIFHVLNTEPAVPSKINPRIPPLFDMIVKRALQKSPSDRYQSANEIASALSDFVASFAMR